MQAFIVDVNLYGDLDFQAHHEELIMLAKGAGATIIGTLVANRERPDPAFFIGKGKVEEAVALVKAAGAEIVIFGQPLSPAQQRNLQEEFNCRVVDRVALILDIFALRAQSHEGKIQVELAQLQYMRTRLSMIWSKFEQQQGGIGTRGPGETQLELDRRIIGGRIKALGERLKKVRKQRENQRRQRMRSGTFMVSLVGYTNTGKSTLFNAMSRADAYAADQLFATLDTTTRRVWIEGAGQITLSDTVGFIRELPTTLIEAFKATLEESLYADVLLHVIDSSSPQKEEQIFEVNKVLQEIGAQHIPTILVYNKIDLTEQEPRLELDESGRVSRVFLSAAERSGLEFLREAIVLTKQQLEKTIDAK
ncbi:GTP-binding protein HflX [Oligella urethralis]|uniref:GTPase HflX n=1 Tax=Oligella urethralis TaxID=90245 RepID=UPI000DF911F0|nr:GTPase HflX [Oligella urethralis]SUA55650.1 GTP-binding protein HflX [Oligella urethralis]